MSATLACSNVHQRRPGRQSEDFEIPQSLLRRHLGLPPHAEWETRFEALRLRTVGWYQRHGSPWTHTRRVQIVGIDDEFVRLENGSKLTSRWLARGLRSVQAHELVVLAVSAGPEVDDRVAWLWDAGRPDEAIFLNAYTAGLTEHLRDRARARLARRFLYTGQVVLPHYCPGYEGWDLTDQAALYALITEAPIPDSPGLPGALEVLPSGGLRPSKSTLAVLPIARRETGHDGHEDFWSRQGPAAPAAGDMNRLGRYTIPEQALARWKRERLEITTIRPNQLRARFRFEGTTCNNLGVPLAFDYEVDLRGCVAEGYRIVSCACRPRDGIAGHRSMCAFMSDPRRFVQETQRKPPWIGEPLDRALAWRPRVRSSGCLCTEADRDHKWSIVLETLCYALIGNGKQASEEPMS